MLRNEILLFIFAFGGVIRLMKSSVDAAVLLENSLVGLRAVVERVGNSFHTARIFAEDFIKSGLINIADTAEGLKNLLSAGFGMDEATKMMNVLTDSAAFNRQGTLALGEAVVGATQGIKNQNSIMVDNAGITKNLSVMYKEYAQTIGKTAMTLTEAEKRQAIYHGILKEGAIFAGNASLLTRTYSGAIEALSQKIFMAKAVLGTFIQEALKPVIKTISLVIDKTEEWIKANELGIKVELVSTFRMIGDTLRSVIGVIQGFSKALDSLGLSLSKTIINVGAFLVVYKLVGKAIAGVAAIISAFVAKEATSSLAWFIRFTRIAFTTNKALLAAAGGFTIATRAALIFKGAIIALGGPVAAIVKVLTIIGTIIGYKYFSGWLKSTRAMAEQEQQAKILREGLENSIRLRSEEADALVIQTRRTLENAKALGLETKALEKRLEAHERYALSRRKELGLVKGREALEAGDIKEFQFQELEKFTSLFEKSEMEDMYKIQRDLINLKVGDLEGEEERRQKLLQQRSELSNMLEIAKKLDKEAKSLTTNYNEELGAAKQVNKELLDKIKLQGVDKAQAMALVKVISERLKNNEKELLLIDKANERRGEVVKHEQVLLKLMGDILGITMGLTREEEETLENLKEKASRYTSLLKLIEDLQGKIAGFGLTGVAKDLNDFNTSIIQLRLQYKGFVKDLAGVEGAADDLKRLKKLIDEWADKGFEDIIAKRFRDLDRSINQLVEKDELGKFKQQFVNAEEKVKELNKELKDAKKNMPIEEWEEMAEKVKAYTLALFKSIDPTYEFFETQRRGLEDLEAKLETQKFDKPSLSPFADFVTDLARLKIEENAIHRERETNYRIFVDKMNFLKSQEVEGSERLQEIDDQLAQAQANNEASKTNTKEYYTEKRIELMQKEAVAVAQSIERIIGGYDQLGEFLYEYNTGQEKQAEEQRKRQKELFERGQITQEQYQDRLIQIDRAKKKEREKLQAEFAARSIQLLLNEVGDKLIIYGVEAAAAAFAHASKEGGFFAGLAAGAAAGAWYVALGAGLKVAGGYGAAAIRGNNLGASGGYLGTPTEDVFEERSKRLGGSIKAQEVHLSINPVTYIQSEGDIFIGEGITIDTFRGLVNEAFIKRAQEAIETGELELDSIITREG